MKTYQQIIFTTMLVAASLVVSADTGYMPTIDGDVSLNCACVVGYAGCEKKFWDTIQGSERHSWSYSIHVQAGHTYNLDELCYRKRDVDKMGDGLCCTTSDEKTSIENLFRGTVD